MRTRIAILGAMLAAMVVAGCTETEPHSTIANAVVDVRTGIVRQMESVEEIAYSGTIEASETIALSFATGGRIARILVEEGDEVETGQLLAELESEQHRSAAEMARATLEQAEDALRRLEPMYEHGNLPEIKLVEVRASVQQARAAAAMAEKNLADCRLIAPTAGMIGRRAAEPGMTAIPNITSIDVVHIDRVRAKIAVPEAEITSVGRGQSARIRVRALGNDSYTGQVVEVGVVADHLAHSYMVRIDIDNPDRRILPGMLCEVTLERTIAPTAWIPTGGVMVDESGSNYAFAVREGRATRIPVSVGRLLRRGIEITSGLAIGDTVVVAGQQKLVDGDAVRAVDR